MAVIVENTQLTDGIYAMRLYGAPTGQAGQFLMVRPADGDAPFLPRPISLFDCEAGTGDVRLLYQVVGKGTKLLTALMPGQKIDVHGPYGNGFPLVAGDAVLIGGGIGTAPLYLLLRKLREQNPARRIAVHLGYRGEPFYARMFSDIADMVDVRQGGFITDDVGFSHPATYYACGPEPMLRAAHKKAASANANLYVSLEKRMACGAGACLGCSIPTRSGNRRVCKDGPVFLSSEVFFDE